MNEKTQATPYGELLCALCCFTPIGLFLISFTLSAGGYSLFLLPVIAFFFIVCPIYCGIETIQSPLILEVSVQNAPLPKRTPVHTIRPADE